MRRDCLVDPTVCTTTQVLVAPVKPAPVPQVGCDAPLRAASQAALLELCGARSVGHLWRCAGAEGGGLPAVLDVLEEELRYTSSQTPSQVLHVSQSP